MKSQRSSAKSILIALILSFGFILAGCEKEPEGAAEKAGKAIDEAAENAETAVTDAAEDAGEKMEEAGEAVKKAAE
jgi:hypothetical protein